MNRPQQHGQRNPSALEAGLFSQLDTATAVVDVGDEFSPITVIANDAVRRTFDAGCIQQAVNARRSPGVSQVVLNPDAHLGYGAPVGCVMASPTHIYPGPVGVDIKCSMSLLQTDLPSDAIEDRSVRRKLIRAIAARIPTGPGRGQRHVPQGRSIDPRLGASVLAEGASKHVCRRLGIPVEWISRCEDSAHVGPDGSFDSLAERLEVVRSGDRLRRWDDKINQLGSYGGGNHFGECEVVHLVGDPQLRQTADQFGLRDRHVAFLSHCGSRGIGHNLATRQFADLKHFFQKGGIPFPAGDPQLVYAEVGSPEADRYLCDMAMGANFATVNHLLINTLVLEAFQEVFRGIRGSLVYFISHNIARQEPIGNELQWVHRKGATRAFPAGHPQLLGTPFESTGHPILLPGNPRDGSSVMVACEGAARSCFSVNHGAGRAMSRRAAKRGLDQTQIDAELDACDILSNCRQYPRDEAPAAYKDFRAVLGSVEQAGLAREVARLEARFVLKDAAPADD